MNKSLEDRAKGIVSKLTCVDLMDLDMRISGCYCAIIEMRLVEVFINIRNETLEEAARIAEENYEDHCCEDCPCSYWRLDTAQAIREKIERLDE